MKLSLAKYLVVLLLAGQAWGQIPSPILLWPDGAPNATGNSNEDKPAIYVFQPDPGKATGATMLVVPGGGFQTRVSDHEGVLVAQWLRKQGIAAFMLRYRIRPIGTTQDSIADFHRAIRHIRAKAQQYKISPTRIGAIGFSAGAELINLAAVAPSPAAADSSDPVERVAGQVNFAVLAYGSTNAVTPDASSNFPPTFMFCTAEDASHINGMLTLYTNLRRARVPVEAHWFADGEHGVGFAHGDPVLGEWPNLMLTWIKSRGLLSEQPRIAITGMARLDGEPLPRGVVVFTPAEIVGASPAAAYVFNTGPVRGQFNIPADKGLIPGKYRVEVQQYAARWMSNSREPFIVAYNQKARGGNLTDQDREEYLKFARARDLEPTIDDVRVFTTKKPGDKEPIIVEVKAGASAPIDIDVFSK